MRRIIIILLLLPSIMLSAQDNTNFTCFETDNYRSQFTITPPDITFDLGDIAVTALGRGSYEPVIGVSTADGFTDCYSNSVDAEYYDIGLPSGDIPSSFTNASGVVYNLGGNIIQIAEANDNLGAVVVVLEAVIFEENHTYQLNLSEAMLEAASESGLNAYLLSYDEFYQPSLTLTDSEGTEIIAEASDARAATLFGESVSGVAVALPSVAGQVELTVNANEIGAYALIIELQSGEILLGDAFASVTTSDEGAISLQCDSETVFENGMRVYFPDDASYAATILASPLDPILAVLNEDDTGFCYDDTPVAFDYTVDLPSINIGLDVINAQADITPEDDSIVFGGRDSSVGDYVLVIEGGEVSDSDDGDLFEIALTPQMLSAAESLTAYVFTTTIELDPILTWEPDIDDAVTCNDAGLFEACDQEFELFDDSVITFSNFESITGIDFNPMLQIPIDPDFQEESIRLRVTANDETSGEYILVLHLITD